MNKVFSVLALSLMLAACNKGNVKPPTVADVSCTTAAGMWYEAGKKYHAGKYTAEDVAALKADAAVLDPLCDPTSKVEPTAAQLATPAAVAAFADLTKRATK